ncbi:WAP four-disulfide core domain protein 18-like [Oculina patagonica]
MIGIKLKLSVGLQQCFVFAGPILDQPKCPKLKPGTVGFCVEACSGDNDCPAGYLCCSNGCGHTCQPVPTLGQPKCPKLKPGTVGICVEACSGDSDCPAGYLCCSNGCGHTCKPGQ